MKWPPLAVVSPVRGGFLLPVLPPFVQSDSSSRLSEEVKRIKLYAVQCPKCRTNLMIRPTEKVCPVCVSKLPKPAKHLSTNLSCARVKISRVWIKGCNAHFCLLSGPSPNESSRFPLEAVTYAYHINKFLNVYILARDMNVPLLLINNRTR